MKLVSAVIASALLQTCTSLVPSYDPSAGSRMALEQARAGLERSPGTTDPALIFAATVESVAPRMLPEERDPLVAEAVLYLDAAADNEPQRAWAARAAEGTLRRAVGDLTGAESALRASLSLQPNLVALPPLVQLLATTGRSAEVPTTCAALRPSFSAADEIHLLMGSCAAAGDPLAWATPADQQLFARVEAEIQAAAAAAAAQRAAEEAALYASFSAPSASSAPATASPSSAPSTASVTLKNTCPQTVRLFFGDKPKYGSGRYDRLSANTLTSYSMRPGDMIWIVDDSDNGLSSTSVGAGSARIEVTESCTGFVFR